MIRKLIAGLLLSTILFAGFIQTSCMGKFVILKKLYAWNQEVSGNKFVNNLIFWVFSFFLVYPAVAVVDAVIFNLIEFWTGNNPIAMNEGDRIEKRMNDGQGHEFLAISTKNRMEVKFDGQADKDFALVFQPNQKAWMLETNTKTICVAKELDATQLALYQPDGTMMRVSKDFDARLLAGILTGKMVAMK